MGGKTNNLKGGSFPAVGRWLPSTYWEAKDMCEKYSLKLCDQPAASNADGAAPARDGA